MKRLLLLFSLLTIISAVAEENPLEINGFADFYFEMEDDGEESVSSFKLGQVEIDLARELNDWIAFEAALAFNDEEFEMGSMLINFHLMKNDKVNVGLSAGQMDVPFGIDWHVYPSIDRKLVSAPLVVEEIHDSWNGLGVVLNIENQLMNLAIYSTNGFEYRGRRPPRLEWVNIEMERAYGGRIGFTPLEIIEIGGSYAVQMRAEDSKVDMGIVGLDVQAHFGALDLKGEYIYREEELARGANMPDYRGFYGQATYSIEKWFVVGRYGTLRHESGFIGLEEKERLTFGIGRVLAENAELRLEYQSESIDDEDFSRIFLQAVIAF